MKYELAIFDLDGTLIETAEDLGEAANHALRSAGLPLHDITDYRRMVGHGVRNLMISALPEDRRDEDFVSDRLKVFLEYYTAHIDVHSRPYPRIVEMIEALKDKGCLCAVASNKFQEGTEKLIRRFFPEDAFFCIYGNRSGIPLKPDPAVADRIIAQAAELSGKDAATLRGKGVFIGDAKTDTDTAAAAGMDSIGVTWGFKPREELLGAGRIVDSVAELRDALLEE